METTAKPVVEVKRARIKPVTYQDLNIHQRINVKGNYTYHYGHWFRLKNFITRNPNVAAPIGQLIYKQDRKTNYPAYEIKY